MLDQAVEESLLAQSKPVNKVANSSGPSVPLDCSGLIQPISGKRRAHPSLRDTQRIFTGDKPKVILRLIKGILEKEGSKVIIMVESRFYLLMFQALLVESFALTASIPVLHGDIPLSERDQFCDDMNSEDKRSPRIALMTVRTGGK